MNKGEKRQKAEALHQELEKSRTVILAGFEGITVAQVSNFVAGLRKWGQGTRS